MSSFVLKTQKLHLYN